MIFAEVEMIQFVAFGLDLVEPNSLITDGILGLFSYIFGFRLAKLNAEDLFFKNWIRFFYLFAGATLLGGIGHTFINYFGIIGKIPGWVLGILSVYFLEFAMVIKHPKSQTGRVFKSIAKIKLILVLIFLALILIFSRAETKVALCILIVIINTLVGVTLSAGVLGAYYNKISISRAYLNFLTGVLIMIPSSAIFLLDINLHRWFDKNDLSHLILGIGIAFFYKGIRTLHKESVS